MLISFENLKPVKLRRWHRPALRLKPAALPCGNFFVVGRKKEVASTETWNTTLHESSYHIHTRAQARMEKYIYIYIYTAHHVVLHNVITVFQLRINNPLKWELGPLSFSSVFATDFLHSSGPVMSFLFSTYKMGRDLHSN